MKNLFASFKEIRKLERYFVEDQLSKGKKYIPITPLLMIVIAMLYSISPIDLFPEYVFGAVGYMEDVLIITLIAVYNNPIEVLESLLLGKVKRTQLNNSMNLEKISSEDRLKVIAEKKEVKSKPQEVEEDTTSQGTSPSLDVVAQSALGNLFANAGKNKVENADQEIESTSSSSDSSDIDNTGGY